VLKPIEWTGNENHSTLEMLANSNFDNIFFKENQVILINIDRRQLRNKDFRINERIFREELQLTKRDFDIDHSNQKSYDNKDEYQFRPKSEVVIKLNRKRDVSPN